MPVQLYYEMPELLGSGFQTIVNLNLYCIAFDSCVFLFYFIFLFKSVRSYCAQTSKQEIRKVSNCAVGRIYSVTETTSVFGSLASSGLFKAAISQRVLSFSFYLQFQFYQRFQSNFLNVTPRWQVIGVTEKALWKNPKRSFLSRHVLDLTKIL